MLYSIELHIGITPSISLILSICVLFISVMQFANDEQFSNITCLSLSSAGLAGAIAPAPVTAVVPSTNIYASL